MIRTDLHNANLIVEAGPISVFVSAELILPNLFETTSGDEGRLESHVLGEPPGLITEASVLVPKGLPLSIGVPVIMGLIVSVVLVEGVVQVAIDPGELRDVAKEVGHLRVIVGFVVIAPSDRIQLLVKVRVNHLISQVIVRLLPHVLWEVR
eukprot:CAMPEP_0170543836 /NCGR_PEP_ID=MMETSP0211-20121228/2819_1 /TAXON_ID=311385 /ORGANISM="Pseudokeronopsis sp., Strain OXSARD2" /LENGTH=150 /DNA_ID=CAMNT_0010847323 /DNA_START=476 /DNA_END=928 /DNA_ORIENTATION=+